MDTDPLKRLLLLVSFLGVLLLGVIIFNPKPSTPPEVNFGLKGDEIIEGGVIKYQNNTLIGNIPPATPKVQVLGILKRIAFCESSNRQYNSDGSVLRGRVNPKDVGLFQINERWWGKRALEKNLDLTTKEGNIKMAMYIYEKHGTWPWNASKHCWGDWENR